MDVNKEDNDFFDEIEEDVFGSELKKSGKIKWIVLGVSFVLIAGLFVYVRFFLIKGRLFDALQSMTHGNHNESSTDLMKLPVVEHLDGLPVSEKGDDKSKDQAFQKISSEDMHGNKTPENTTADFPTWNLAPLYTSISDQNIKADLDNLATEIESIIKMVDALDFHSGTALFDAFKKIESVSVLVSKLSAFITLTRSVDISNPQVSKLYSQITHVAHSFSAVAVVFESRIAKHLTEKDVESLVASNPQLQGYKYYMSRVLRRKDHMLSEETERYAMMSDVSKSAWSSLFDKTLSAMTFDVDQQKGITTAQILSLIAAPDRNIRLKASNVFGDGLKEKSDLMTSIYNAIVRNYIIDSSFRHFGEPISARNFSNDVEDSVVSVLIETVRQNYPLTSHKYYAIKAKLLGLEKMHYSDRLAPMLFSSEKHYQWDEAKDVVLSSFSTFSGDFSKIAQDFFDNNRIHAVVKKDKESGAFCLSPYVTKPFVLLNYMGRREDVSTLAHELGHGIHGTLSMKQSYINSSPPLTLAETASLFAEKLVDKLLLERAKNILEKASLLAANIERMLNSVNRQIAFVDFERRVFEQSRDSDLTKAEVSKIWMDVQKESLGEIFTFDDSYQYYWTYVSHFFHYPFYVYSYAFADLLVNSLFRIYEEKKISDFDTKYTQLLAMGGSDNYKKLLEGFGINPADPDFWQKGMDSLIEMINDFEKLTSSEEFVVALQSFKKGDLQPTKP